MILSGEQLRGARAMARLEQSDLASRADVSVDTIKRLERMTGPVTTTVATLTSITKALEAAGVEFIPENGGGPGVRLRKAGMRSDDHAKPVGPATDAVEAMDAAITQDRAGRGKRVASVKETGEEVPQEEWERFEQADKTPGTR